MILYNITFSLDERIVDAWLTYLKEEYIPEAMKRSSFESYKFLKLLSSQEEIGTTYCCQFMASELSDVHQFQLQHAEALDGAMLKRFPNQCFLFSTILEYLPE